MSVSRDSKAGLILGRFSELPSLPKVVDKILSLSEARSSTRQFADLIATDQGLAAKVLRLVNSAFYSMRAPVSSIQQASALLGVRTLKSLALSVSVIQVFKHGLPCFNPARFWRHGLAAAVASFRIAEQRQLVNAEEAYATGLLHDIGIALLVQHYPKEYEAVAQPDSEGTPEGLVREAAEFGESHPEIGFLIAAHWRLPGPIALGIRHHHTALELLPPDLDESTRTLIEVVQAADACARRFGYHFAEVDRKTSAAPLTAGEGKMGLEELGALAKELDHAIAELELCYQPGAASSQPEQARSRA